MISLSYTFKKRTQPTFDHWQHKVYFYTTDCFLLWLKQFKKRTQVTVDNIRGGGWLGSDLLRACSWCAALPRRRCASGSGGPPSASSCVATPPRAAAGRREWRARRPPRRRPRLRPRPTRAPAGSSCGTSDSWRAFWNCAGKRKMRGSFDS